MATAKKKINLFETEEGAQIKQQLILMTTDNTYSTIPTYSANTVIYPNNLIPFVEKHMSYLNSHPTLDPIQYIANLRLVTRIR